MVVARLDAHLGRQLDAAPGGIPGFGGPAAREQAPVFLFDLVAVNRIVRKNVKFEYRSKSEYAA
jgi:hypothetical protein